MDLGAASSLLIGFKRNLRAEIRPAGGAFLFSERGVTSLRGAQVDSVVALLDGTKDVASVLRAKPGQMEAEETIRVLERLMQAGLVTLRPPDEADTSDPELAFWDACGVHPGSSATETSNTVRLVTAGDAAETDAVAEALWDAGLSVRTGGDPSPAGATGLSVVLCDDYLLPVLGDIDAEHRKAGSAWLLAKPIGAQVWVGPVFQPGDSACWHCLATRLWGHRHAEACAQAMLGHRGPAPRPAVSVPPLTATAANLVALEASKWLAGYRHDGQRCVWTFDSLDLRGRFHEVRRRPQCPECGDPSIVAARAREPVRLRPTRKAAYSGSGYRSHTPEQVLEKYRHLVSPVTGVIKEIRRDPRGPALLHSYRSGPNFGARVGDLDTVYRSLRDESGGKGVTAVDAEVGALCEALERYSGRFHGDEERVRDSLRSLGEQAIHPNECMLYDERQYAGRAGWNAAHAAFQHVCEPFDEDAVTDWTPVWSLTGQRHRLLPTGLLYYAAPDGPNGRSVLADSNGAAAGSSVEDAVLQGLLELVERDAVALWWYNRTSAPGVELDAFGDPWIDELRRVYDQVGRDLWVLDVTADLGIPVMVALSRLREGESEEIMFGFGAHLDPRIALRRALTELNQLMPVAIAEGLCHDQVMADADATRWWRDATVANQPYLLPAPDLDARTPGSFRYTPGEDLAADVDEVVSGLAERGLETLVLDQTRPDIGLPVVKVIVPGMRHFWARFAPGRLFDVPVQLGRLDRPTPYDELNPLPVFL